MRTALAILIACAAFGASLACSLLLDEVISAELTDLIVAALFLAYFLAFFAPSCLIIAGGVVAAPRACLRSHILDSVRGDAPQVAGRWGSTAFIGLAACLVSVLAAAAIRVLSPMSFPAEENWHDMTLTDGIELAAVHFAAAILCWVGLLNITAWICLKIFGTARRTFALAMAIIVLESLGLILLALLSPYLDYHVDLIVMAESLALSTAKIVCAWLYVTRTLEHGLLALLWFPVVVMALRPLWDYLGV